jgi:hypothetical protein
MRQDRISHVISIQRAVFQGALGKLKRTNATPTHQEGYEHVDQVK